LLIFGKYFLAADCFLGNGFQRDGGIRVKFRYPDLYPKRVFIWW
jgi:hypothetical protein